MTLARALTIAGSDPGGGAGIQADLKTFTALGVYGMAVITAVTAQNTLGVSGVYPLTPDQVAAQIDAVLSDIGADAAKTGMLFDASIIEIVADRVQRWGVRHLVVDPVLVAKGGQRLLKPEAEAALRERLLPLAALVTPNLPEAAALTGLPVRDREGMVAAARRLVAMGARAALVKGGHLEDGTADDLLYDGQTYTWLPGERVQTRHTHGTGCTLSAAITAGLAQGLSLLAAVRRAKAYVVAAIRHAPGLGAGHGPLNHLVWHQPSQEALPWQ